jgi:prophage antirepressor-like protein
MLTLLTPEGSEVRTIVDEHGMIWWVALDVGNVLGIVKVRNTLDDWPDDEKALHTVGTLGGPQDVITLNEPGLYRLIFASRKPEAEAFKRWILHEVLPMIRRTGGYQPKEMLPAPALRIREHAEVSTHMLAMFRVLNTANEPLSNREIARQAGIAERTARAHTRYFMQLGFLERLNIFPRNLYVMLDEAAQHHYWQRLDFLNGIVQARQAF